VVILPCVLNTNVDSPLRDCTRSVQDPFQTYQDKLNAKISRQDQSEDALALRAAKKAAREADRTTWLGTDLGEKGKRKLEDDSDAAVGKYLASKKQKAPTPSVTNNYDFGGASAKKPKKLGNFGDFSGW
jgi:peptidyl-prolyl cis-trans isomerase-like protein 2